MFKNEDFLNVYAPNVMGILNLTPDSFFSGSRKQTEKEIAERAIQIVEEGGTIIDVGGYSSRPNAAFVSEAEELERLRFGLKIIVRETPHAFLSVDTFRSNVARECMEEYGVSIINDISGGQDEKMYDVVANKTHDQWEPAYILMHMNGTPQTMMEFANYGQLIPDLIIYFSERIKRLQDKGIQNIWIDPGFGFSKTTDQNYELLYHLDQFKVFDLPLVAGFSRKTMIREVLGVTTEEALNGTTALNMCALTKGANILRVHDVKEALQTIQLYEKIRTADDSQF